MLCWQICCVRRVNMMMRLRGISFFQGEMIKECFFIRMLLLALYTWILRISQVKWVNSDFGNNFGLRLTDCNRRLSLRFRMLNAMNECHRVTLPGRKPELRYFLLFPYIQLKPWEFFETRKMIHCTVKVDFRNKTPGLLIDDTRFIRVMITMMISLYNSKEAFPFYKIFLRV